MTLCTIVQARMGSTRLPGKALKTVGGKTILEHVLHRISLCPADTGRVVVATGVRGDDQPIADWCAERGVDCFRGSSHDVLNRYYRCALDRDATRILRVTADCPLLCPQLTADLLQWPGEGDYITTEDVPLGLTPELITADALYRCWRDADEDEDREHVTLHAIKHPHLYDLAYLTPEDWLFDRRRWRLTVDEQEDIDLLQRLWMLTSGRLFDLGTAEIVDAVEHDIAALQLATRQP